jgi:hypothetical protein
MSRAPNASAVRTTALSQSAARVTSAVTASVGDPVASRISAAARSISALERA